MRLWMIAFSLGVLLAAQLPRLPPIQLTYALLACAVLLQWWPPRCRTLGALLLGVSCLCVQATQAISQRWPEPPYPRDVWVEGTVWNLPVATDHGLRVQFRIDKLCLSANLMDCDFTTLRLDKRLLQISLYQTLILKPGQRWRWLLRLKPPHGFVNPGGFDYEAWLLQQGLSATGYVRENPDNLLLNDDGGERSIERWRLRLAQTLANPITKNLRWPHLLQALTIGDGSGISGAEWDLFAATGTTHLLVISGSHVALITVLLYGLGYWLGSRSATVLLCCPATWPAALLALVGAWIYTGLAGFSLPAQRAWIMITILLLATLLRRHLQPWHSLCLALAAVLAFDPLAVLNAGFWLSFAAVAVLLFNSVTSKSLVELRWWQRGWQALKQLFWLQLQLSVALLPIVLVYFQQTSLLAPLVNLPLIPVLGWGVVPLALAGVVLSLWWPSIGLWLLLGADCLLDWCMSFLQWSAKLLPTNVVALPSLNLFGVLSLVVVVVTALVASRSWLRLTALLAVPLVFGLGQIEPQSKDLLRLQMFDVGQGLAVLISSQTHHLLYDVGPQFSERFDAGSDVVIPALRTANIKTLDNVMISHSDQDHAGGLAAVLKGFPSAVYSSSKPGLFPTSTQQQLCRQGQRWQWDGINLQVLHPDNSSYDDNNGSCVLLVEAAGRQLLLTGDIEKNTEQRLLQLYPALKADVVVVPHHGSNTSSSLEFVQQLAPLIALYSSGYQNRYQHPTTRVQQRYQSLGSRTYNTASDGAILLTVSATGELNVAAERELHPHFWRSKPASAFKP